MPIDQCPQAEELSGFVLGTLDPALAEPIVEHLDTCSLCEQTVHQLEAEGGSIVEHLRATPTADSFEAEAGYRQALERIEAIGRELSFNTQMQQLQAENEQAELGSIGHYQLLARLGAGGMGTVYKALHTRLDKVVALKILSEDKFRNPQAVARFDREMKAVGKLDHAHILRAMDAGEADGRHFLVTEYIEGCDLAQLSRQLGPLPIPEACELVRQAALGLQHAHEHNMVHRDIKPANLYLSLQRDHPPRVKILDLGLALTTDFPAADDDGDDLTGDGEIMGTLDYMAPEQAGDTHNVSIAADIYSLGATLYKLLTGHSVYYSTQKRSTMQKLLTLANETAPPIQSRRNDLPDDLAAVVHQMLDKDSKSRHATPAEVARALEPFCTGQNLASLLQQPESQPAISTANPTATSNSASLHDSSVETQDEVSPHPDLEPTIVRTPNDVASEPSAAKSQRRWRRWAFATAAATAILLGVILIQTPDGTIRIETNQTDVEVLIDDEKTVYITDPNDKTKISVKIPKGAKTLRVRKAGFVANVKEFDLETEKGLVTVSFVPANVRAIGGKRPTADSAPSWKATPAQQAFIDRVAKLPPEEQVEAVRAKLREVNPGFDGEVTHKIEAGHVSQIVFYTDVLSHIWPIRGLRELKSLKIYGTSGRYGKLSNLAPLAGMRLLDIDCYNQEVADLSSLRGMKLINLRLINTKVTKLESLTGMPLNFFDIESSQVDDISPLRGMPLRSLSVSRTAVEDISPLTGMSLVSFKCTGTKIADLAALQGMPLAFIKCSETKVSDLSPLKNTKLTELQCAAQNISDLAPLKGLPLSHLDCRSSKVSDLSPLNEMPLKTLNVKGTKVTEADVTTLSKSIPGCRIEWDGGVIDPNSPQAKPWQPTVEQKAFIDSVAKLPAAEQVEAVRAKLKEVNPGFDGAVTHKIEDGAVTEFSFVTDEVTEIWPVRGLAGLKALKCGGSAPGKGKLADLPPLAGMKLTLLYCYSTQVEDLTPLRGMKLTSLSCSFTPIADLTPLKGMPLTTLNCEVSEVSDLSPLAGMPLESLNCEQTKVAELSPLRGLPLTSLDFASTKVSDLSPLKGMALTRLFCGDTEVKDLSPLSGMPLNELDISYTSITELTALKGMPLRRLVCFRSKVADISPLAGMTLETLDCNNTEISDLSPMVDIDAQTFLFGATRVTDISPLKGKRITLLGLYFTHVADLSVLKTMKLKDVAVHVPLFDAAAHKIIDPLKIETVNGQHPSVYLAELETQRTAAIEFARATSELPVGQQLERVREKLHELNPHAGGEVRVGASLDDGVAVEAMVVARDLSRAELSPLMGLTRLKKLTVSSDVGWPDLSFLKHLSLDELHCRHEVAFANSAVLKKMTSLKKVNGQPAAEYWKQIQEKLKNRDAQPAPGTKPWQPSKEQQKFLDDVVKLPVDKQVEEVREKLMEINPGFDGKLSHSIDSDNEVVGVTFNTDQVTQIWPVRAFGRLVTLYCSGSRSANPNRGHGKLSDLSALAGMRLNALTVSMTQVTDLTPLIGMPLQYVKCSNCPISDLAPLRGMALETLLCFHSDVADLSPIRGMPLSVLGCAATRVTDISAITELPLKDFACTLTHVVDVSPILSVKSIGPVCHFDIPLFDDARIDFVRKLEQETINGMEKAELIKQLETRRQAAFEFAKKTSMLDPQTQLTALGQELMRLNGNKTLTPKGVVEDGQVVEVMLGLTHYTLDASPLMAFKQMKKLTLVGKPYWPDLSGLKHVPIEELNCPDAIAFQNSGVLKTIESLKTINGKPAAEYWEELPGKMKPVAK